MANIKVYNMDSVGVVVDTSPIGNAPGTLTKSQNAVPEPGGEAGTIVKRPGWKKFMSLSAGSKIGGGVGVPFFLGSAGKNFQNPFTDIDITLSGLITFQRFLEDEDNTTPLGATFSDDSFIFDFDFNFDFDDLEAEDELDEADLYLVSDAPTDGTETASTSIPFTWVGNGEDYITPGVEEYVVFLQRDISDGVVNSDPTLPAPNGVSLKFFPDETVLAEGDASLNDWFNGSEILNSLYGGRSTCNLGGALYYIMGGYAVGTANPTIRRFDGYTDRVVAQAPNTGPSPAKAIIALLVADGKIYFSTFDGGTNGVSGGTITGSVCEYNPDTNVVVKLGATFPTGHMPYALTWAYGRLWCGTSVNNDGATTAAKVYWIRPGLDSIWTLDKTFANNEHMVMALATFQGQVYAAIWKGAALGVGGSVQVRSTTGVWTSSDAVEDEYFDIRVWPETPDEGVTQYLYSVSETFPNRLLRRMNGGAWATVSSGLRDGYGEVLTPSHVIVSNTLKPCLFNPNDVDGTGKIMNTVTGSSWTRQTISPASAQRNECVFGLIVQV